MHSGLAVRVVGKCPPPGLGVSGTDGEKLIEDKCDMRARNTLYVLICSYQESVCRHPAFLVAIGHESYTAVRQSVKL